MSNNSPLLLILNKISVLLFISLVGKYIYILSRVFFPATSLDFYTSAKEAMSFHLFPLLCPFSWGKGHVSVRYPRVDLSDRSSLCFCDSQPLGEREKEQGVGANDKKSAEGGTKADVTFNSIDLPSCHPYPTPAPNPSGHTQAQRYLRRLQSWLHQSSSGFPHHHPSAEGRGQGLVRVMSICQEYNHSFSTC